MGRKWKTSCVRQAFPGDLSLLPTLVSHPPTYLFHSPPLSGATTADKRDERERRRKRGGIDPPVQLPRFPPLPFPPPSSCVALAHALGFSSSASVSVLFVPSTSPFVDYSWEEVDGDALQYSIYILLSRRE